MRIHNLLYNMLNHLFDDLMNSEFLIITLARWPISVLILMDTVIYT